MGGAGKRGNERMGLHSRIVVVGVRGNENMEEGV
jgi:hypothetical protein